MNVREDITKEMIEECYRKGLSQREMARELGVGRSTITNRIKEFDITVPSKRKTKASNYDEKALIRMLENGWTYEQIANCFEVNQNTVYTWVSKHNLQKHNKKKNVSSTNLCKTCVYGCREATSPNKCNYLLITGHSRCMGKPEVICSKYEKGKRIKVKSSLGSKMA